MDREKRVTDEEAKRQFIIFAILRVGGLVLFLLGIAIAFTDLLKPGGWKLLGGILAIVGAIEAVVSPRLVNRTMARTDDK
jgi:membrane protein implicated in regulation of membrane protease activity